MKIALIIIALLLTINSLSYFFISRAHKGIRSVGIRQTEVGDVTTYFIGEIYDTNTHRSFDWILNNISIEGGIRSIECSNFGFDPKIAAKEIDAEIVRKNRDAVFITVGLGSEIPLFMSSIRAHIAINPVFGGESLMPEARSMMQLICPVIRVIEFVIGWLAYLPIIEIEPVGKPVSISLVADYLKWSTRNLCLDSISLDGLLISTFDKISDSDWLYNHATIDAGCVRETPFEHTDMARNLGCIYAADLSIIIGELGVYDEDYIPASMMP